MVFQTTQSLPASGQPAAIIAGLSNSYRQTKPTLPASGQQAASIAGISIILLQRISSAFASLAYREFRLLWYGQLAQAGTLWAEQVTRSWLAFELTGSAFQLGSLQVVRGVSSLVLGMWGGVLADRFSKKALLMATQTWTLTIYALLAVVTLSNNLELWHLYVSAVGLSLGGAINQPVRTAIIPSLVPESHILNALSLNSIAINASRLGTPIAVTALIALTGNGGWGYAICAILYVLILWFTLLLKHLEVSPEAAARSMVRSMWEGLAFVAHSRVILAHMLIAMGPLAFGLSFQWILVVYATETLGLGVTAFGALFTAGGLGALFGGILIASSGTGAKQGSAMLASGSIYGLMLVGMGLVGFLSADLPLFWFAAPFIMVIGASQSIFRATNNSRLLANSPAEMRGRVMGLTVPTQAINAAAALMAGGLAEAVSPAFAMGALGVACLSIVLLVSAWEPRIRGG